jgi:hypothetical protein
MSWEYKETKLTDLVILGRAAPEEMSDGRQTVCTGAWSPEHGFIRLYPIDPETNLFSRWNIVNAEVERNPDDARHESWKIKGRKKHQNEKVEVVGEYPRHKRATLLHHLEDNCVNNINDAKRSLGIVRPETAPELRFQEWEKDDAPGMQAKLFEEMEEMKPDTREDFDYNIKVRYECGDCKTKQGYHEQTLLEWGAYMGLRSNPDNPSQLRENYRFNDDDFRHWLFVGNMNKYKSSFITISVLWLKKDIGINSTFEKFPKVADDFAAPTER